MNQLKFSVYNLCIPSTKHHKPTKIKNIIQIAFITSTILYILPFFLSAANTIRTATNPINATIIPIYKNVVPFAFKKSKNEFNISFKLVPLNIRPIKMPIKDRNIVMAMIPTIISIATLIFVFWNSNLFLLLFSMP